MKPFSHLAAAALIACSAAVFAQTQPSVAAAAAVKTTATVEAIDQGAAAGLQPGADVRAGAAGRRRGGVAQVLDGAS